MTSPQKETFNKAKLLTKYFSVYGYGNFDLTNFEINNLLDILNKRDKRTVEKLLKKYYEILESKRMG